MFDLWQCIIHVVPVDDLRDHAETVDCWCCPTVEIAGAGCMVVHNSMDGREDFETGARKLS